MAKKLAAATKIEVRGRTIQPGEIVSEDDFDEADGVDELIDSGALEAFDEKEHGEGWYQARYAAELDRARGAVDNEIRSGDSGSGTTKGR